MYVTTNFCKATFDIIILIQEDLQSIFAEGVDVLLKIEKVNNLGYDKVDVLFKLTSKTQNGIQTKL